jgi:hypothetical protein
MSFGEPYRVRVSGVGMADHSQTWIARQHSFQSSIHLNRAIGHHDHPGVLRVSYADSPAVM